MGWREEEFPFSLLVQQKKCGVYYNILLLIPESCLCVMVKVKKKGKYFHEELFPYIRGVLVLSVENISESISCMYHHPKQLIGLWFTWRGDGSCATTRFKYIFYFVCKLVFCKSISHRRQEMSWKW